MNPKPVRILFISYYSHPQNLTATRNFYLSQLLAEAGHDVHVITSGYAGTPGSSRVKRHVVNAWDYRKLLIRIGVSEGVTSTFIPPGRWIQWGYKFLLRYPFNKWLGEGGGFYYLKAVKLARDLMGKHDITHVFSSYRPMADHFIAAQIKITSPGITWIGDFRDVLWWEKKDPHYREAWLRQLISGMDHITAVTHGIGAFWGDVFHRSFIAIYNGFPLDRDQLNFTDEPSKKFVLNYTGRIYTEFQHADILFQVLKELTTAEADFAGDLSISYSGISSRHWEYWMKKFELLPYSTVQKQVPVMEAWKYQALAQINLLLTWTTPDISGFIHGKFNEYLAMRRPILCLVDGDRDQELETIYAPLTNSLIAYNAAADRQRIKAFIWNHYLQWKSFSRVDELPLTVLEDFQWSKKGLPLLDLIHTAS